MDRRAAFFGVAAVACLALIPVAPPDKPLYRWAAIVVASVYAVLALASWLDRLSRSRIEPRAPMFTVGDPGDGAARGGPGTPGDAGADAERAS